MKKIFPLIVLLSFGFILTNCSETQKMVQTQNEFNPSALKPMIQKLSHQWSVGLKTKDIDVFRKLYDKNGHYMPDDDNGIHGGEAIAQYWASVFDFVFDIQLTMESLEGTKDLLYETGHGLATFPNIVGGVDTGYYKYVNVWKLQNDGTYKVVIDTWNNNIENQKQNKADLLATMQKHLDAVSNKDLKSLKETLAPTGEMQLMLPFSEIITSVDGFMDYHKEWFKDPNWTFETKILSNKAGKYIGTAITEIVYKEPNRNGKPYFNRMTVSYTLQKYSGKWYVISDHASTIEKTK